jgi:hypothetical protein
MKKLFAMAFVFSCIGGSQFLGEAHAAAAASDELTVLEADRNLIRALASSDKKTLERLLDKDFTWTNSTGKTQTRADVLKEPPAPLIAPAPDAQTSERSYGKVGVVRVDRGKQHAMRVWVKHLTRWQALLVHEVTQLDKPASPSAPGPAECDNPCKKIPYKPKSAAEKGIIASWQQLETAVTTHDADAWSQHFLNEFVLISSNGAEPSTKAVRMATIQKQKETNAPSAPPPLTAARMHNFGDTVVMLSLHQPHNGGKPLRVSRVWVKGKGLWQMAISFQTRIEGETTSTLQ